MLLRGILVLQLVLALTACQRPFEEPDRPRVIVLRPDLSEVQEESQIELAVRVSAPGTIEEVIAGTDTLSYDPDENAWRGSYVLTNGLNQIVLAITDADLRTTLDTLYALRDVLTAARSTPHLPAPRGGHTATMLQDGRVVILGGAPSAPGDALDSGLLLTDDQNQLVALESRLHEARTGHSATLLPDGRVLIVGGSVREGLESVEDLVETVELFDPADQSFKIVTVHGEPIRRAFHTASLHEEAGERFIDLYGGVGDVSYRPPIFGTRADVRRFRLRGDSLTALDPAPGPQLNAALAGHTQIELYPSIEGPTRYIISGTYHENQIEQDVSFVLEYRPDLGLLQHFVDVMNETRTRHAAALLQDGFVGFFGGRRPSRPEALGITEVYAAAARRYFRYRQASVPMSRYGHTATKVRNERILLLGGFLPSGEGAVTTELYSIPYFEGGVNPVADATSAGP